MRYGTYGVIRCWRCEPVDKQKTDAVFNYIEEGGLSVEEEEWIRQTMERKGGLVKVLSVSPESAVSAGSSFMSDLLRLRLEVRDSEGREFEATAIYKALPSDERRNLPQVMDLYMNEAKIYSVVLPLLVDSLKEFDIGGEALWPECYGIKEGLDGYLLKDLSALGYKSANRFKGLDFAHLKVALDRLAKFHAISAQVIENENQKFSKLDVYPLMQSTIAIEYIFKESLNDLADSLEEKWQAEWSDYGRRVRALTARFGEELVDTFESDKSGFRVLCHGDYWMNNIMFKYDQAGKPTHARFFDFQLSFVGNPCVDLHYIVSTSIRNRDEITVPDLLRIYHTSLDSYLTSFGYAKPRPTLEDIEAGFRHYRLFGLVIAICVGTLAILPPSQLPALKEIKKTRGADRLTLTYFGYEGEDSVANIKYILTSAKENGII